MKTNLPDYPRIALAELSSLKLDAQSARRFERRFYPGLLGGTALAFGGFGIGAALLRFGVIPDWTFAVVSVGSLVTGLGISLWTHHGMLRVLPHSIPSGHLMQPFIIRDLETVGRYEIAYIDQDSGTYFRRLYVEPGG